MSFTVYFQTARDLGRFIDSKGQTHYRVGNADVQENLHVLEYVAWKDAMRMESIDKWREEMTIKFKQKTKVPFINIERYLLEKKLLHPLEFNNLEDPDLQKIFVVRNAFAFGERNGKWVIAPHDNNEKFFLKEEDFKIWILASKTRCLTEIVDQVDTIRNCGQQQALDIVTEKARLFIRTGLWTAEYYEEGV